MMNQLNDEATAIARHGWAKDTTAAYFKYTVYFIRFVIMMEIGANLLDYNYMQNYAIPMYIAFLARSQVYPTVKACLNGVRVFYS